MTYTDRNGRPEIIAEPGLKSGSAAYRIEPPSAVADETQRDEAAGASTGGAALFWIYCEHAC